MNDAAEAMQQTLYKLGNFVGSSTISGLIAVVNTFAEQVAGQGQQQQFQQARAQPDYYGTRAQEEYQQQQQQQQQYTSVLFSVMNQAWQSMMAATQIIYEITSSPQQQANRASSSSDAKESLSILQIFLVLLTLYIVVRFIVGAIRWFFSTVMMIVRTSIFVGAVATILWFINNQGSETAASWQSNISGYKEKFWTEFERQQQQQRQQQFNR